MTLRANLQIAGLAALIAIGGGAVWAKGGDHGARFGEIDTDGNGQVTQAELKAHAEARFAAADTDGDGLLSSEEMMARQAERVGNRAAQMLERFDADGNGALDLAELEAASAEWRGRRSERREGRQGRMMERMDANADGKLSMEELMGKRDPAKMFERMDADGNGTLSVDEFDRIGGHGKRHGKAPAAD